ncbi:MepB family protein [Rhodococcus sp. NPDC127528]|uniref:MepB family protein n=1 Tax=unclassified Rhodococcus (in: high G+C Gram-positive bacteria) TaxID=192944 RepID=UPI00363DDFCB
MTVSGGVHPDVAEARRLIRSLGSELSAAVPESGNAEYAAFVSRVGRRSVRFRASKLTPAKVGAFVATWRRADDGSTEPFASEGGADLLVITVREEPHFGLFAFPRAALIRHGIVSVDGRGGKRGFRVYPPWSETGNRQAQRTQEWQCHYFLGLDDGNRVDMRRAQLLLKDLQN